VSGFAGNRLQSALFREAVSLVWDGVEAETTGRRMTMAWASSLVWTVRKGFRPERVLAAPGALVRASVATAAAAAIGWVLGDTLAATMMIVGAFIVGIGTLLAPLRNRVANALVMGAGFTGAALVGVYVQPWGWWMLVPLAVFAFGAGLVRALGPVPGIRAVLVVIGLLITADVSPSSTAGLELAKWIAAGSALVVLTQLLPPYGRRFPGQRSRLAVLYRALAGWSRSGAAGHAPTEPFTAARSGLRLLPRYARPAAAPLYGLLGEAERIRRALATAPDVPHEAVAAALDHVAAGLGGRPRSFSEELSDRLAAAPEAVREPLHEAARLAEAAVKWTRASETVPHAETSGLYASAADGTLRTLRDALRPGAPLLRHALRLSVGAVAAEAAGRAIGNFWGYGLPQHGFWAALTAMLVLFPDYEHTFARGWTRPAGSIAGGLLAWVMFQFSWSNGEAAVATVVFAVLAFAALRTGQHVLHLMITPWLVFLLYGIGSGVGNIAFGRPADTLLGALVGLVVFLLLPTWHHNRAPLLLGRWLEVQSRFLPALLLVWAERGALSPTDLEQLREDARDRRHELEDALARLPHEPRGHLGLFAPAQLAGMRTAVREVSRSATQLVVFAPASDAALVPELAEFAEPLRDELARLAATALGEVPVRADELRAAFDRFTAASGLTVANPVAGEISAPRARALSAWRQTISAVEAVARSLATPQASRHHAHVRARDVTA
jgi:uncharacterized membrane protein YccC